MIVSEDIRKSNGHLLLGDGDFVGTGCDDRLNVLVRGVIGSALLSRPYNASPLVRIIHMRM